MNNSLFNIPYPINEPVLDYEPGSKERAEIEQELKRQSSEIVKIPLIINGKEIWDGPKATVHMPHNHKHILAEYTLASEKELKEAVEAAVKAKEDWYNMPWAHRAAIFLKAAELIAGPYRAKMNAATMLGQSKTVYQAEIDSACEIADFLRFNVYYAEEIFKIQPESDRGIWNRLEHRPLSGFVLCISPFNFTAIGGNLPTAPAIMGNTAVWKPAGTAVLSNYIFYQILVEAGIPAGVINFVPSSGEDISKYVVTDKRMAGFHFTGSTKVFSEVWKNIGNNISNYENYPRLVGETGGKDFIFAHPTTEDTRALAVALVRGAYEYQGQKCSACSRAYIPASIWPEVKSIVLEEIGKIKVGDVADFKNFMGAVIDKKSYDNIVSYIKHAEESSEAEILTGSYDDSIGYFIQPTLIQTTNPKFKTMVEEIFGPVLTVYVYEDEKFEETIESCKHASPYALTGAIFAKDRNALAYMEKALSDTAGNFYLNDKPTGAVVGQQPFGGGRASGTNDKAGSILNMLRWSSPRTIKETFISPTKVEYPFME